MKKTIAMIICLVIALSLPLSAIMEAAIPDVPYAPPAAVPNDDESPYHNHAYDMGQEIGKKLLAELLSKSKDAEPFKFLDEITWGMTLGEIEALTPKVDMIRMEDREEQYESPSRYVGFSTYGLRSYADWPEQETYITFYVHHKRGLFQIEVELFMPIDSLLTLNDANIERYYNMVKLQLSYEHGMPAIEIPSDSKLPHAGWLLKDATILRLKPYINDNKLSESYFTINHLSPEHASIMDMIDLEESLNMP